MNQSDYSLNLLNPIKIEAFTDEYILAEIEKLQVFYNLKHEIRYGLNRDEKIATESVAEHVFGMMIINNYFLPLENPEKTWDQTKINNMVLYHDIDEIETGDIIGYLKTTEQRSVEIDSCIRVLKRTPISNQKMIQEILEEYSAEKTTEAKFVKALDKLEPVFQCLTGHGKAIMQKNRETIEQCWSVKRQPLRNFPVMLRYCEVGVAEMEKRGHFTNGEVT